jgi:hypothetical protein
MSTDDKKPGQPRVARGERTRPSTEAIYGGKWMRSLFEVQFAKQLDHRQIAWDYEPERLKGGGYLVDFHLPELKCWVEVKGRFEPRDDLLLPLVAGRLKSERSERLFLYMKSKAYRVTSAGYAPLTHDEFWEAIADVPEDDDPAADLPRRTPRDPDERRPWRLR